MAQLPTPTVSGSFSSASRVDGTVTWPTMTNLNDLDQVRVRYARHVNQHYCTFRNNPWFAVGHARAGQSARATRWGSFSSGGRSYGYRDDVITGGFDNTPSSYTDRTVSFNETGLSGYNVWAIARLEV